MDVAGGGVALGKEKGLFSVLVDSDVHDEDGVTEKFTFARVDKDIAWLDFGQCAGLHCAREGESAGDAIEVAKIAVQGFSRCTTAIV